MRALQSSLLVRPKLTPPVHVEAAARPGRQGDVDPVVDLRDADAEVGGGVDRAELLAERRLGHLREPGAAHRPADRPEPRIRRHRDAVGIVVGGRRPRVVPHREAALPAVPVRDLGRDPGQDLMFETGRDLPVVTPVEPSQPDVVRPVGNDVRLPEVLVVERADFVRIDHQVAVQVVPGNPRAVDGRDDRVQVLAHVDRVRLEIPAERGLERRPAVAEQVVGHPEPWVQVLPVRRFRDPGIGPPRRPGSPDRRPRPQVEIGRGVLRRDGLGA